jgi:hypothetical protein
VSCAFVSATGRSSAKLRRSPFTEYWRAGNVTLRPAPVRRSQIAKPISFRPAKTPLTRWISASASFPGGLPLSLGVILTVTFCVAATDAFGLRMFSSEPRVYGFLRAE